MGESGSIKPSDNEEINPLQSEENSLNPEVQAQVENIKQIYYGIETEFTIK